MLHSASNSADETSDGFESIVVTSDFEPYESTQLGLGNSSTVGTAQSSKFSVTTIVRDVRRGVFKDGRDPAIEHAGVVVILGFEFGLRRIDEVTIKLDVDEAIAGQADGSVGGGADQDAEILIKARFPQEARGPSTEAPLTQTITASIEPSTAGFSAGGIQFERSTTRMQVGAATLTSFVHGDMAMEWKLEGDGNLRAGVPKSLTCAVLLQTDGLPFEISAAFSAPLFGRLYWAKPQLVIGQKHLWERMGRDSWEAATEWTDFDSDEFHDWIKRKTKNEWAETVLYASFES
ncbi:hypothetical protein B0I35DRAFT_426205 [Stachybotrys elegans]|uniref:Uncharacterized protein n=1 Tax=Stachybotrys elegans TaxID=80388 RepID=A0A8K0WUK4_9HYPO|nr:hypothetical protein B0I35DRAFT_426205 [Stachybotrys elegans]